MCSSPCAPCALQVGRSSGLTRGTIMGYGVEYHDDKGNSLVTDFLILGEGGDPFDMEGDSGSAILLLPLPQDAETPGIPTAGGGGGGGRVVAEAGAGEGAGGSGDVEERIRAGQGAGVGPGSAYGTPGQGAGEGAASAALGTPLAGAEHGRKLSSDAGPSALASEMGTGMGMEQGRRTGGGKWIKDDDLMETADVGRGGGVVELEEEEGRGSEGVPGEGTGGRQDTKRGRVVDEQRNPVQAGGSKSDASPRVASQQRGAALQGASTSPLCLARPVGLIWGGTANKGRLKLSHGRQPENWTSGVDLARLLDMLQLEAVTSTEDFRFLKAQSKSTVYWNVLYCTVVYVVCHHPWICCSSKP